MTLLLDHLWQSTMVLAGIGLLAFLLRGNGAHVRHALWTAASLKFLLPFALLNGLGHWLSAWLSSRPVQPVAVQRLYDVSQPFSDGPVFVALPAPAAYAPPLTAIWLAGMAVVGAVWLSRWWKLHAVLRAAYATDIAAPMPVRMSASLLEPGLIGIFRPVLLLPKGIEDKLSPAELQAIITHEACHLRRRDNLAAALHMLVETLFWFWPPVWWLGARLVAEREKACDEAVLAAGNDPQTYAQGILKVCRHYIASPLACAAGVSGADLKQRMEDIMKNAIAARLTLARKALLAACAAVMLALPLAAGVFTSPPAQAQQATARQDFAIRTVDEANAGSPVSDPVPLLNSGRGDSGRLWLKREGQITGNVLADARVDAQRDGTPLILFRLTPEAGRRFGVLTAENVGRRIALVVDGKIINEARVMEPIRGGSLQVSGDFDMGQARLLVAKIMGEPR